MVFLELPVRPTKPSFLLLSSRPVPSLQIKQPFRIPFLHVPPVPRHERLMQVYVVAHYSACELDVPLRLAEAELPLWKQLPAVF